MDHRWTHLLDDLRKRFAADTDVVEVEAYLSSQGYDRRQIGEILALLYSDIPASARLTAGGAAADLPLRVQGPHERGRFTPEAWGYLVLLGASGVMSSSDFEQLVERALVHVDGRIGLPDLRALAEEGGLEEVVPGFDRSLVH